MTECIIRRLTEISGTKTTLELKWSGGIALYPEKSEIKERFCDGGVLVSLKIRLVLKGTEPDEIFKTAEKICNAADASDEETAVYRTENPPVLEGCAESGLYKVSCVINADYIKEAENEDSI